MLEQLQRCLNNAVSTIIERIFNKIIYNFISLQIVDLLKSFANNQTLRFYIDTLVLFVLNTKVIFKYYFRVDIVDAIAFAQMQSKFYYNRKHQLIFLNVNN